MSIKHRLLLILLSAAPCLVHAASFYVEPRVSWLKFSGTPNIGDRGWSIQADEPDVAPTLAVGYELTPHVRLELRATNIGTLNHRKLAPSSAIFPGDEVSLPYVRPYEFHQSTKLYTLAVPLRLAEHKRLAVSLTPLLVAEDSVIEVADYIYLGNPVLIQASSASSFVWPTPLVPGNNRRVLRREDGLALRAGAEIALRYAINDQFGVTAHCNWMSLRSANTLSYGAGVELRF